LSKQSLGDSLKWNRSSNLVSASSRPSARIPGSAATQARALARAVGLPHGRAVEEQQKAS